MYPLGIQRAPSRAPPANVRPSAPSSTACALAPSSTACTRLCVHHQSSPQPPRATVMRAPSSRVRPAPATCT